MLRHKRPKPRAGLPPGAAPVRVPFVYVTPPPDGGASYAAAMEMMAVDPMIRVIGPRFVAGLIAMPLLAAMLSAIGVLGGYLIGHGQFGLDAGVYWSSMQTGVDFKDDILNGVIKSFVFGFIVIWVALFEGYHADPTSEGVSRATTRTVVTSSLAILGGDYILTSLMFGGL